MCLRAGAVCLFVTEVNIDYLRFSGSFYGIRFIRNSESGDKDAQLPGKIQVSRHVT
jgi:hypothetical protein